MISVTSVCCQIQVLCFRLRSVMHASHNSLNFSLCQRECTHLGGGQCACFAAICHHRDYIYLLRTFLLIFMMLSVSAIAGATSDIEAVLSLVHCKHLGNQAASAPSSIYEDKWRSSDLMIHRDMFCGRRQTVQDLIWKAKHDHFSTAVSENSPCLPW